jgi:sulfur carrier protein ThiS
MQLNAPTPLKDILGNLRIPLEEVHLVALNGVLVDVEESIISDTDVVRIFSGVNGG